MVLRQKWLYPGFLTVALLGACNTEMGADDSTRSVEENGENEEEPTVVEDVKVKAADPSSSPALASNRGNTVVVGLQEPGGIFTPHFNTSGYDGNVQAVMFPPLVDINEKGEPFGRLAEDWDISEDELTYTYYLRDDLKFDDGSPLTANDVAFTVTLLFDPDYPGTTDLTETNLVGGLDYKEGDADSIAGIHVIDDQMIEFQLEEPNARALTLLGGTVLSENYYGEKYEKGDLDYMSDYHLKPLGAGPFKFEAYHPGEEIRFSANEHYYNGKPEVDTFVYRTTEGDSQQFFQTGELDYSGFVATKDNFELLESMEFANIDLYTSSNYSYIAFNHESEVFKDPNVRIAFNLGLDRQAYIDARFQGYAQLANVPVSPISWAYTDEIEAFPYDPEEAKRLLDEAGWKEGPDGIREKDGQKLTVYFFTTDGSGSNDIFVTLAQENYKDIGVDFQIEQMDFNALLARVDNGDHDLVSFSTTMQPDPHIGVQAFHSSHTGNTFRGYKNEEIDRLIEASVAVSDLDARAEAYHELYEKLKEDPPIILLNYNKSLAATNARVEGFEPNGFRGISLSLENLRVVDTP
ncbi:ABC transporter substrate-binding protein [Shouchella clausii]|nr:MULTISPECIES: ABC transporter substrate-binding protein [Shouchella]ALA52942.1 Oligopeptide ABC transporter, periplasmic oligopeptide-binding protein OppA [Shouchella clausii]MDP0462563.1 ABC transporter substrate-binding protein [Shouchella rhizosphaerae]MDP5257402.1 ABC transporter substrate-binding protein [Shouchella clausii]MDP5266733.1 ABC transporter substrate-binding protein [Shouchella clausii]MDP5284506.1 ABC transporter substrate-binding protein [Shouchella clausii]